MKDDMTNFSVRSSGFLTLLFLLFAWVHPQAQTVTGSISGIVTDQTGAVVPAAKVTLTNVLTQESREVVAGGSGQFSFSEILPAVYEVAVEARGFKRLVQRDVSLSTSEHVDLHQLAMQIGSLTESVSVATQQARVETENGDRTGLVTQTQIDTMPNSGLNYLSTLRALPGIAEASGGGAPVIAGGRIGQAVVQLDGVSFQDNGVQGTGGNYTPNLEAIGEIKVMLSNFSAEYGTRSGGQINVSAKSGTNQFHGSVYTFLRNEAFDARNYFATKRARDRFLNPGFTIGGPLYVPRLFNTKKDKLFFFYAQEWLPSSSTANPAYMRVPTLAERRGDFSALAAAGGVYTGSPAVNITCPGTTTPLSAAKLSNIGTACPGYPLVQASQYYMNAVLPLPNNCANAPTGQCAVNRANDSYVTNTKISHDQELARLDWTPRASTTTYIRGIRDYQLTNVLSDTTQLFCNPIATCAGTQAGQWPFIPSTNLVPSYGVVATWVQTLTTNLVNEFTVGFNINVQNFSPTAGNLQKATRTSLGMTGANSFPTFLSSVNNLDLAPYTVFTDGNFTTGPSFNGGDQRYPFHGRQEALNYTDNLSFVHGPHSMKFGVYVERGTRRAARESFFNGQYSFYNDNTAPLNTNFSYVNAMLGIVTTLPTATGAIPSNAGYNQSVTRLDSHGVYHNIDWYLQDTWKVNKRLSMNYGIRFQMITPTYSQGDQQSNFVPSAYNRSAVNPLISPTCTTGTSGCTSTTRRGFNPVTGLTVSPGLIGAYAPDANGNYTGTIYPGMVATQPSKSAINQPSIGFGPRFGFAYDVFGNGKTALRGGIGMFNDRPVGDDVFNQLLTNPPSFLTYTSSDTTLADLQGICCATKSLYLSPIGAQGYQTNFTVPGSYNWSFGVQQDIGHGFLVDVAYQGNVGRHLRMQQNINAVNYGTLLAGNPNYNPQSTVATGNYSTILRPYAGDGPITYITFDGTSNYHSLQTRVTRRFGNHLTASGNWTYSKVLDFGLGGGLQNTWYPYISRRRQYGPAITDRRHIFTANWTYAVPDGSRIWHNLATREVLDGWQLAGLVTMQSGTPLTVTYSIAGNSNPTGAIAGDGLATAVNVNGSADGGGNGTLRTSSHLNVGAISIPNAATSSATPGLGNGSLKKIFTGPGLDDWDISLFKNFYIGENKNRSLELRMETFNTFNHTQFSTVTTAAQFLANGVLSNAAALGTYTAANAPRTMQLTGRFKF